jgi:hypothetical protein
MLKLAQFGRVDIPTANTRVQICSTQYCTPAIVLTAAHGNTGNIYIGDSSVGSASYSVVLSAGQTYTMTGITVGGTQEDVDITTLYADTATSGNDVHVSYYRRV